MWLLFVSVVRREIENFFQDGGHQINVSAYFGQPGIPIIEVKSDSNPSEVIPFYKIYASLCLDLIG